VGEPLILDLTVSGLAAGAAPSLGAWFINISYDPAVFSIAGSGVTFGPLLGDSSVPEAIEGVDASTPGLVKLNQTSFLPEATLDALQPASFSLATLEFTGVALGTSVFDFTLTDLSDAAFPANSIAVAGTVTADVSVVPEPSTFTLFGVGVFALIGLATHRRSKNRHA